MAQAFPDRHRAYMRQYMRKRRLIEGEVVDEHFRGPDWGGSSDKVASRFGVSGSWPSFPTSRSALLQVEGASTFLDNLSQ